MQGSGMVDLAPDTKVVAHALELTRDFATRTGLLAKTELLLEQADVPIRPAEFLFYVPIFAVVIGSCRRRGISWLTGGVVAIAAAVAPFAFVRSSASAASRRSTTSFPTR